MNGQPGVNGTNGGTNGSTNGRYRNLKKPRVVEIRRVSREELEEREFINALIPRDVQNRARNLADETREQSTRDVMPVQNQPGEPRTLLGGVRKKLSSLFR